MYKGERTSASMRAGLGGSSVGSSLAQIPLIAELSVICALVVSGQLSLHLQDIFSFLVTQVPTSPPNHADGVTNRSSHRHKADLRQPTQTLSMMPMLDD